MISHPHDQAVTSEARPSRRAEPSPPADAAAVGTSTSHQLPAGGEVLSEVGPIKIRDVVRDLLDDDVPPRMKAVIGKYLASVVSEFADELDARLAVRGAARR
jgi:hypothetical protein